MILHQREDDVYRALKGKMSTRPMASYLGISRITIRKTIGSLKQKGVIQEVGKGKYLFLIDEYEVTAAEQPRKRRDKPQEIVETPNVSQEQAALIKRFYHKVPRSQLAKTLKVGKVQLNMMIIEMGLGS